MDSGTQIRYSSAQNTTVTLLHCAQHYGYVTPLRKTLRLRYFSAQIRDYAAQIRGYAAQIRDYSAQIMDYSAQIRDYSAQLVGVHYFHKSTPTTTSDNQSWAPTTLLPPTLTSLVAPTITAITAITVPSPHQQPTRPNAHGLRTALAPNVAIMAMGTLMALLGTSWRNSAKKINVTAPRATSALGYNTLNR